MNSVWIIRGKNARPRVTSAKNPDGVEHVPASDYIELIDWISGHKSCEWKADDNGTYFTGCGEAFEFTNDGPEENNARFCMYCGNKIISA